ncbi:hypothetical protein G5I_13431 [Acromyrmex echinatior]|uniref:Uncharacterized protein n=1 Tax=Acromyrmex echinatior TaxID=103372 RepID=F4X508_ACREC|nr:hypothetical protein G5I_13431 [Acromyrmex echinatior]
MGQSTFIQKIKLVPFRWIKCSTITSKFLCFHRNLETKRGAFRTGRREKEQKREQESSQRIRRRRTDCRKLWLRPTRLHPRKKTASRKIGRGSAKGRSTCFTAAAYTQRGCLQVKTSLEKVLELIRSVLQVMGKMEIEVHPEGEKGGIYLGRQTRVPRNSIMHRELVSYRLAVCLIFPIGPELRHFLSLLVQETAKKKTCLLILLTTAFKTVIDVNLWKWFTYGQRCIRSLLDTLKIRLNTVVDVTQWKDLCLFARYTYMNLISQQLLQQIISQSVKWYLYAHKNSNVSIIAKNYFVVQVHRKAGNHLKRQIVYIVMGDIRDVSKNRVVQQQAAVELSCQTSLSDLVEPYFSFFNILTSIISNVANPRGSRRALSFSALYKGLISFCSLSLASRLAWLPSRILSRYLAQHSSGSGTAIILNDMIVRAIKKKSDIVGNDSERQTRQIGNIGIKFRKAHKRIVQYFSMLETLVDAGALRVDAAPVEAAVATVPTGGDIFVRWKIAACERSVSSVTSVSSDLPQGEVRYTLAGSDSTRDSAKRSR